MTMMDRILAYIEDNVDNLVLPKERIEAIVGAALIEMASFEHLGESFQDGVSRILDEAYPTEGRPSLSPTDIALRDARNRLHLCTTMLKGLGPSHDLREHYASLVEMTKAEIADLEGRPSSTPEEDKARKEEILKELKALGSEYRGSFSSSFETWNARHEALTAELRDIEARHHGN